MYRFERLTKRLFLQAESEPLKNNASNLVFAKKVQKLTGVPEQIFQTFKLCRPYENQNVTRITFARFPLVAEKKLPRSRFARDDTQGALQKRLFEIHPGRRTGHRASSSRAGFPSFEQLLGYCAASEMPAYTSFFLLSLRCVCVCVWSFIDNRKLLKSNQSNVITHCSLLKSRGEGMPLLFLVPISVKEIFEVSLLSIDNDTALSFMKIS